jgi:hypothetical protein
LALKKQCVIQICSGTSLSLVLRQDSAELEGCSNRLRQVCMSSTSKLIELARKHIMKTHDFCICFNMNVE